MVKAKQVEIECSDLILSVGQEIWKAMFNGKTVKKGQSLKPNSYEYSNDFLKKLNTDYPNVDDDNFNPLFHLKNIFEREYFVKFTEPAGDVVIDNNTVFINPKMDKDIIKVKTKPDLSKMYEVANKSEWNKITDSYKISSYEDEGKIIYFYGEWYWVESK